MKLKKIASLALAGIMAVSMLTACGEGGKKEEDPSSSEVTTVSGAAEALNAALLQNKDVIKFENDSELDKDLEAYYRANPIKGDEWNLSKTYEIVDTDNDDLNKFIDVSHSDWRNFEGMIQDKTNVSSYPDSRAVVGMFNAEIFTKADALKVVGTDIDGLVFESDGNDTSDGKEFVYTGKASIIEVSSEKGAASVWVVVAVVEKDYTTI